MRLVCHLRQIRGSRPLAEIARETGINRGNLSLIELGRLLPSDDQLSALEWAYGQPAADWYDTKTALVLRPEVKAGQVWADNDPRHPGRTLTVVEVGWLGGEEIAVCVANPSSRRVTVRTSRLRPTRSGYRLMEAT